MLNIDEVITAYGQMTDHISDTTNARAELAALRATVAEYDRIAELIDPNHAQDISIYDQIVNLLHDESTAAIVAEQARQIETARAAIDNALFLLESIDGYANGSAATGLRAWLASTAPAPQAEQEQTA